MIVDAKELHNKMAEIRAGVLEISENMPNFLPEIIANFKIKIDDYDKLIISLTRLSNSYNEICELCAKNNISIKEEDKLFVVKTYNSVLKGMWRVFIEGINEYNYPTIDCMRKVVPLPLVDLTDDRR